MPRPLLREYLEALLVAVLFATFARTFVVQAFKIPTGSMEENLLVGDHVLVNKFVYGSAASGVERALLPMREVRRGDVVVFKYPEEPTRDFIKRCVGLPGDTITIADKVLYVNGKRVEDSSYTYHDDDRVYPRRLIVPDNLRLRDNFGPFTVPAETYFCLGDNRDNSHDSRFWGPVPASFIKGRAFLIYWSFEGEHEPVQFAGYRGRIKQLGYVALNFLSRTRWGRSFQIVR